MTRFTDQVAFITGGAGGIGAATARRFAQEGGKVVIVDRVGSAARSLAEDIVAGGGQAIGLEADTLIKAQVDAAVATTIETWGRIDVLVNLAGGSFAVVKPISEVTDEEFHRIMDVNVYSTFACTRAVVPHMIQRGYGRIINIGSRTRMGEPRMAVYSGAKTAMEGFSRSLALELGPSGITVNVVAPGSTQTRGTAAYTDRAERDARVLPEIPVGRFGLPEDQAAAILFFASPDAGYITSEILTTSGGRIGSSGRFGLDP